MYKRAFVAIGSFVVDIENRDIMIGYNDNYPAQSDYIVGLLARWRKEHWNREGFEWFEYQGGQEESYGLLTVEAPTIEEAIAKTTK